MIIELKKVAGSRLTKQDSDANETFCILSFVLKITNKYGVCVLMPMRVN